MDIVKQGYVRVRSKRLSLWKKRWIILRRASSKGPVRLEKYFDERSSRNVSHSPKVIFCNNVSNVCRLSSTVKVHSFAISFDSISPDDSTCKWFACDSDLEADSWVKLFIQECLLPQPGLATGEPDVLSPGIQKELQEQFHVYLMPNPKLDAFGECLLQVTPENIYLWDVANSKLKLVNWPLTSLRRYGSDPTKFTFEAGRHCATGEGMFVFHTLVGEKIYRKVHQATLAIAEAHYKSKRNFLHPQLHQQQQLQGQHSSPPEITSSCINNSTANNNFVISPESRSTLNDTTSAPSSPKSFLSNTHHHPDVFQFNDSRESLKNIISEKRLSSIITTPHHRNRDFNSDEASIFTETAQLITPLKDIDDSQAVVV